MTDFQQLHNFYLIYLAYSMLFQSRTIHKKTKENSANFERKMSENGV